jgi:type IV secretion system protein TrbL
MTLPSLTNVLMFFEERLSNGRGALLGDVTSLAGSLVTFEVVFAGIYLALGSSADFRAIARKILTIGFFFYVIRYYADILRWLVDGFLYAGEKVGSGSAVSFASLRDPGLVFQHGLQIVKPLINKIFASMDSSWMGLPSIDALWLLVCIFSSLLAFAVMSIQVFVTYLEYLLVASAGFLLVPFGIFKPTAFLAERVFGAVISFGIKLMTLALIIGISDSLLQTVAVSDVVTWQEAVELSVIAMALCFLSLHAPSVAQSLLSGSPHLTFSTVSATTAAAPGALSRVASSITSPVTGTASATLTAAGRIAGGVAPAMSSVGSIGGVSSLMGKAGRVAAKGSLAAVGGVAGLVAGTVNRPIKESIATYKEGQWSVPEYRKASLRRDTEKARGANKTNQASSAGEKSS